MIADIYLTLSHFPPKVGLCRYKKQALSDLL